MHSTFEAVAVCTTNIEGVCALSWRILHKGEYGGGGAAAATTTAAAAASEDATLASAGN